MLFCLSSLSQKLTHTFSYRVYHHCPLCSVYKAICFTQLCPYFIAKLDMSPFSVVDASKKSFHPSFKTFCLIKIFQFKDHAAILSKCIICLGCFVDRKFKLHHLLYKDLLSFQIVIQWSEVVNLSSSMVCSDYCLEHFWLTLLKRNITPISFIFSFLRLQWCMKFLWGYYKSSSIFFSLVILTQTLALYFGFH